MTTENDRIWLLKMQFDSPARKTEWNGPANLWDSGKIGINYGNWKAQGIWTDAGIDESLFQKQTEGITKRQKDVVRSFIQAPDSAYVFWADETHVRWARLGARGLRDLEFGKGADEFLEDTANRGVTKIRDLETASSRCVHYQHLPQVYRLLRTGGRATFQATKAYAEICKIAIECGQGISDEVPLGGAIKKRFAEMDPRQWMDMLPPAGWEALVSEFIRANGVPANAPVRGPAARGLMLADGKTLPDIDLVLYQSGGSKPRLIQVQCKNKAHPEHERQLKDWYTKMVIPDGEQDEIMLVYANRGGFIGSARKFAKQHGIQLMDGEQVQNWLTELQTADEDYWRALRSW